MRAAALLLAIICAPASAAEFLTVPLASYHTQRKGYNQINLGLGYERQIDERWSVGGGFYRNSYRRDSLYVGGAYMRWKVGEVRLGSSFGLVTGYGGILPLAAPTAVWDGKKIGVAVMVTPPVSGKALVGVVLRWRLD